MKLLFSLFFLIFLIACNNAPKQKNEPKKAEKEWKVIQRTIDSNTYTASGLLDTTYRTTYYYSQGMPGIALRFFAKRKYDYNNNLIKTQTFEITNKNKLWGEASYQYNAHNKLILKIEKSGNTVYSITKKLYNGYSNEVEEIEIKQALEPPSQFTNFDSAVAHHHDKKATPKYDTTLTFSVYDNENNLIKKLFSGADQIFIQTLFITYSNGEKSATYTVDKNGDTGFITHYSVENGLIKEVGKDKKDLSMYHIIWYDGEHKVKEILFDESLGLDEMETYKYDTKGNEVEDIRYK